MSKARAVPFSYDPGTWCGWRSEAKETSETATCGATHTYKFFSSFFNNACNRRDLTIFDFIQAVQR
jgi:hypothetical protein